jgi:hypothetical protein
VKAVVWEKQSYKRYSAQIAELPLSVRRCGRNGDYVWCVDCVFGLQFFADDTSFARPIDAMGQAEKIGLRLLRAAVRQLPSGIGARQVKESPDGR